jgi:hypothetical protein
MLIAENCPRALYAYVICHINADEDLFIHISRRIIDEKSLSWTRFCNDIKSLARQGLLEWGHEDGGLSITLAEYEL